MTAKRIHAESPELDIVFGLAPFCEAELFWNSDDPWETILMRARMRALPER